MSTPSRRRREGRLAFYPGGDPNDHNPYKSPFTAPDFVDGWNEAAAAYVAPTPSKFDKARDAVNDMGVFSEDQITALHAMLYALENDE